MVQANLKSNDSYTKSSSIYHLKNKHAISTIYMGVYLPMVLRLTKTTLGNNHQVPFSPRQSASTNF